MKLAAIAGFAAGTAIVVYTFLRQASSASVEPESQQSDSEIAITVEPKWDDEYEPLAELFRNLPESTTGGTVKTWTWSPDEGWNVYEGESQWH